MENSSFVLFWDGPLSQWHPCQFRDPAGIPYICCEQYMMYQKALLFGDKNAAHRILNIARTPKEQKRIGREVRGFDEELWAQHRLGIVWSGNYYKFSQNPALRRFLLSTGNAIIAEASPFDKVWGIGMRSDHKDVYDVSKWRGLNLLGKTLMSVRNLLAEDVV